MDYSQILKIAEQSTVKPTPLFRVDGRPFRVGDIIKPQGNYQEKMDKEQQRIEESLSRTCNLSEGLQRKDCVFVFDDLKNALLFWSKQSVKPNIYKVVPTGE